MLKPTRTILALAAGSLVLGLVGTGAAIADENPMAGAPSQAAAVRDGHAVGRVVSKGPLKVRSKPSTRSRIVGQVYPNRKVEIECKKYGESVDGNRLWYRLDGRNGEMENGNGGMDEREDEREDGREDEREDEDGREDSRDDVRAGHNDRWVAARWVKNLSPVKYCR
ncbi:SH3 domain-containing protein [Streptomyces antarcticus]|uniref:SH3 domain-containing protein n=1 Tax=Streptomyces antarcticus TaxID=2996458 RepID=UPI0022AFA943|nr:SH3 domain-containing protein [Streptomyces sp. H34-S5]MCZ4088317.1 SH3 domain-containing protein [Streptomyces sp. H34-S5]